MGYVELTDIELTCNIVKGQGLLDVGLYILDDILEKRGLIGNLGGIFLIIYCSV